MSFSFFRCSPTCTSQDTSTLFADREGRVDGSSSVLSSCPTIPPPSTTDVHDVSSVSVRSRRPPKSWPLSRLVNLVLNRWWDPLRRMTRTTSPERRSCRCLPRRSPLHPRRPARSTARRRRASLERDRGRARQKLARGRRHRTSSEGARVGCLVSPFRTTGPPSG